MGKSIFNIQEEYLAIINAIEENDGILEPEDEKALEINIEELEDKVRAYHYIIKELQGEMTLADDEIARLADKKKVKANIIKKLKSTTIEALGLYGTTGKSGNKTLDLGDLKVFTRNTKVVNIDEDFDNEAYMKFTFDKLSSSTAKKILELVDKDLEYKKVVDKTKLKVGLNALTEDEEIKGASLGISTSVTFK